MRTDLSNSAAVIAKLPRASGKAAGFFLATVAVVASLSCMDAMGQALMRGAASMADPYGKLVPLRVVLKTTVVEPTSVAGAYLAPDDQIDHSAASFTQTAWMFPRGFDKAEPAAPSPLNDAALAATKNTRPMPTPSDRTEARPTHAVVAPSTERKIARKPHIIRVRTTHARKPIAEAAERPAWVALPPVLAPTARP